MSDPGNELRLDALSLGLVPGGTGEEPGPPARPVILLATSGSRSAIEATVFAAELAVTLNAALRIVHVVPRVEYTFGRLAPMRPVPPDLTDPFASSVLRNAPEIAWPMAPRRWSSSFPENHGVRSS